MKLRKAKPIVILILIMSPFVVYADPRGGFPGFPLKDILTVLFLFVVGGLAISACISLIFRYVLQKIQREKRKHIWFMTISTFIFPAAYVYAEVINYFEHTQTEYRTLIIGLLSIGFLLGYFVTPKGENSKLHTPKPKPD